MKIKSTVLFASLVSSLAFAVNAYADESVQLDNVHLCCNNCVKGVTNAVSGVSGVNAASDKDAGTVVLTAADKPTLQKAVNALVAAGYFGVSKDPSIKVEMVTGAKDATVQGSEVDGVHLCCKTCVTTVNDVLGKVSGVTGTDAAKDAKSFQVKGEFNQKAVADALQNAGLAGKVWTK